MFCPHKNSFLQLETTINPRLLNRAVENAMQVPISGFDVEPPPLRVCSNQPCIPKDEIDVTRAQCAFGRWALPKLYKELHSTSWTVKLQAINTVCDLVKDPEKSFEAIKLNFIYRLIRELLTYPDYQNEEYKERVLLALQTLASQSQGRDEMLANRNFTGHLKKLLNSDETPNIRFKAAALIRNLTDSVTACWTLIDDGYVNLLIRKAHEETVDEITKLLLEALERLLFDTEAQEIGFESDAVERMVDLLSKDDEEIKTKAQRCLALLISHPMGKDLSIELNLLIKLNELLHDERRDVYTSAAQVIMFATHKVRSKHDAAEMPQMYLRLLELCNDFNSPSTQMFAMKALTNICEHPQVREIFLNNHMEKIEKIVTDDSEELKRFKKILIKVIEWKPWLGWSDMEFK